MIATKIQTIREAVIGLLKRTGHSQIEAVDKWDDVYSKLYASAKPGHKVIWHIGEYVFEFTK
jgi:hypothetical protein